MAAAADVARGAVLGDRYRLEDVIGQGGMATVYRAHDVVLGRDVAVKLFPPVAEDADDVLRHQAEMRVLAQMSHPGLVTLHDAGSAYAGGPLRQTYLVMELVSGPTLAARIAQGPLSPQQTALLGRQVAEALAAVHSADVVHRDVKPANVLLIDPTGLTDEIAPDAAIATGPIVKLADFGIARLADGARLTMTGTTLGTATYLSPEQAAGGPVGPATDVYALGLVLLECLTGRKAFTGTVIEVAAARLNTAPPIPTGLGPDWVELLEDMTRRDPAERSTAVKVAAALTGILQGGRSREADTLEQPASPPHRRPQRARPMVIPPAASVGSDGGEDLDGTRRYSTEELRAEAERDDPTGRPGVAPGPGVAAAHHRPSRRMAVAALAALLLGGGAILVSQQATAPDGAIAPRVYPQVDGPMGDALRALQESVVP